MKNILTGLAMLVLLFMVIGLQAADWEGGDTFEDAGASSLRWKTFSTSRSNYQYVYAGQLRCFFQNNESDNPWAWGANIHKIPTAAKWTIMAEGILPNTAPVGVAADRCKVGVGIVSWPVSKRVVFVKMRRSFSEDNFAIGVDADYSSGKDDETLTYISFYPRYRIRITHDALNQTDAFVVEGLNGANPPASLYNQVFPTRLNASAVVALAAVVSGKPNWPLNNTTLGLDDWSMVENDPAPINLSVKSASSGGVSYSVAVTGLDLVDQKLTGTVALTVGAASATIPITGLIDKNGFFRLTAAGTGGSAGFGCTLLYDRITSTYLGKKNSVRAPGYSPIRF